MKRSYWFFVCMLLLGCRVIAQPKGNSIVAGFPVNYDEEKVPAYVLPELMKTTSGNTITSTKAWLTQRRPELIQLFETNQFGTAPGRPAAMHFKVFDKGTLTFQGKALRKQVTVYFTSDTSRLKMDLLLYLPAHIKKPVPLLLQISFTANSNALADSGVKVGMVWTKEGKLIPASAPNNRMGSLDVAAFMEAGIGIGTVYYGDIEPDFKTGIPYGIRGHYLKIKQTHVGTSEWGAIAAWSWGLSRAMDYFETDPQLDAKRIGLVGTSRLGKTVLWTGARDDRFKLVIASCSGEGGAALSRRDYGENIKHMSDTSRYYYQFAPQWHAYASDFNANPVDAHMLVALMAPRPLLLQTGDTDYWSDPKGEYLSAVAAAPVYQLWKDESLHAPQWPTAGDTSQLKKLGYYMHAGGHGILPTDWPIFLDYIKKYL